MCVGLSSLLICWCVMRSFGFEFCVLFCLLFCCMGYCDFLVCVCVECVGDVLFFVDVLGCVGVFGVDGYEGVLGMGLGVDGVLGGYVGGVLLGELGGVVVCMLLFEGVMCVCVMG